MTPPADGAVITEAIDVHIHAVPPNLIAQIASGRFERIRYSDDRQFSFPEMAPSPPAPIGLLDFSQIAQRSSDSGMTTSLVGPWTDLLGYTLDRQEAEQWTRAYNTSLVEACAQEQGMRAVGTVPLQYPELAAGEVVAAKEMGCVGLMIGSDIPNSVIGDEALDPVWEAASAAGLPVLMHPTFMTIPDPLKRRGLKNTVGRAGELAVALADVVYSGMLVRHEGLAFIASHGGGSFLDLLPRVLRNHEVGWSDSAVDVMDGVSRMHWDSVVLEPARLSSLVDAVGSEAVVLGSDAPFPWEPHPVETVRAAGLDRADEDAVLAGTARRLYTL